MQDVSDKLLGAFVACIEKQLTGPADEPEAAPVEDARRRWVRVQDGERATDRRVTESLKPGRAAAVLGP